MTRGELRRRLRFSSLVLVASLALASCTQALQDPPPTGARGQEEESTSVDSVPVAGGALPGFAIDEKGRVWGESLGLYSAYSRDKVVQSCMRDLGLEWHIEALYPAPEISAVADALGVEPLSNGVHPETANQSVQDSLSDQELDAYFMGLYGMTSEELAQAAANQTEPVGGCHEARNSVGGFWDVVHSVEAHAPRLREEYRQSDEAQQGRGVAAECAASFPGVEHVVDARTRDDASDSGVDPDLLLAVEDACGALWEENDARMRAAVQSSLAETPEAAELLDFSAELDARMREDVEFHRWLAYVTGSLTHESDDLSGSS